MTKAAARQFLVTVGALGNRTFATFSGGDKAAETSKWYDGGATVPDVLAGPAETSDVTVTNGFDPELDSALLQTLKSQVGVLRTTITKMPLHGDMSRVAGAKPDVYTNALLKTMTPAEADANSGDVAVYELTFAVADLT